MAEKSKSAAAGQYLAGLARARSRVAYMPGDPEDDSTAHHHTHNIYEMEAHGKPPPKGHDLQRIVAVAQDAMSNEALGEFSAGSYKKAVALDICVREARKWQQNKKIETLKTHFMRRETQRRADLTRREARVEFMRRVSTSRCASAPRDRLVGSASRHGGTAAAKVDASRPASKVPTRPSTAAAFSRPLAHTQARRVVERNSPRAKSATGCRRAATAGGGSSRRRPRNSSRPTTRFSIVRRQRTFDMSPADLVQGLKLRREDARWKQAGSAPRGRSSAGGAGSRGGGKQKVVGGEKALQSCEATSVSIANFEMALQHNASIAMRKMRAFNSRSASTNRAASAPRHRAKFSANLSTRGQSAK